MKIEIYDATLLDYEEVSQISDSCWERICKDGHFWWLKNDNDTSKPSYVDPYRCYYGPDERGYTDWSSAGIRPVLRYRILEGEPYQFPGNIYLMGTHYEAVTLRDGQRLLICEHLVTGSVRYGYGTESTYDNSEAKKLVDRWADSCGIIGVHSVERGWDQPDRYAGRTAPSKLMQLPDYEMLAKIDWLKTLVSPNRYRHTTWGVYIMDRIGSIHMDERDIYRRTGFSREQLEYLTGRDCSGAAVKAMFGVHDCRAISMEAFAAAVGLKCRDHIELLADFRRLYGRGELERVLTCFGRNNKTKSKLLMDALRMCTYCHWSELIRIPDLRTPDSIKEFHDTVTELMNAGRTTDMEELQHGFDIRQDKWKAWTYSKGRYMVCAPAHPAEIANEGAALHHCVRSYITPVWRGETNILFIRRKSSPEKPFFTAEITNDGVFRQIKGYANRNVSSVPGLAEFIAGWAEACGLSGTDYDTARNTGHYTPDGLGA